MAFSKRHYRSVSPASDTAADIKDRIRRNTACELGRAETQAKFPQLTGENADEAIRFQNDRIRHHYELLRKS